MREMILYGLPQVKLWVANVADIWVGGLPLVAQSSNGPDIGAMAKKVQEWCLTNIGPAAAICIALAAVCFLFGAFKAEWGRRGWDMLKGVALGVSILAFGPTILSWLIGILTSLGGQQIQVGN